MDEELRAAQRAVAANPDDRESRAALATLESKMGVGPGPGFAPEVLVHAIHAPWVTTDSWAAVRIGNVVAIIEPGRLDEIEGHAAWMTRDGVGRTDVREPTARAAIEGFKAKLHAWLAGDMATTKQVRVEIPAAPPTFGVGDRVVTVRGRRLVGTVVAVEAAVEAEGRSEGDIQVEWDGGSRRWAFARDLAQAAPEDERPQPGRRRRRTGATRAARPTVYFEEVVTRRTRRDWGIEHIRLACGMDALEPQERGPPPPQPTGGPIKVFTCQRCRSNEGRERGSGGVLCYDCNKIERAARRATTPEGRK